MTCIVGIIDREANQVIIGGDSAGVSESFEITVRTDRKVFKNGKFIFGCTTSFRMIDLLRFEFKPPKPPKKDWEVHEYMCTKFINELRKCFQKGGFSKIEHSVEEGGTFLVGFGRHLFRIEGDFQVGIPTDGFDACGIGEPFARGALYAMKGRRCEKDQQVIIALESAEYFSGGVRGPFNIIKT